MFTRVSSPGVSINYTECPRDIIVAKYAVPLMPVLIKNELGDGKKYKIHENTPNSHATFQTLNKNGLQIEKHFETNVSVTSLCGPGDRNFNAVSHKPTRAPIPMFSNHGDWSAAMREGLRQRNRSMEERYLF